MCEQKQDDVKNTRENWTNEKEYDTEKFYSIFLESCLSILSLHAPFMSSNAENVNQHSASDQKVLNIFSISTKALKYGGNEFSGAWVDSDAQLTVIDFPQTAV